MTDAYPESATLSPVEFRAWRAKHHPDLPRPRHGSDAHVIVPALNIRLGIAHNIVVRYYGGRYCVSRT